MIFINFTQQGDLFLYLKNCSIRQKKERNLLYIIWYYSLDTNPYDIKIYCDGGQRNIYVNKFNNEKWCFCGYKEDCQCVENICAYSSDTIADVIHNTYMYISLWGSISHNERKEKIDKNRFYMESKNNENTKI